MMHGKLKEQAKCIRDSLERARQRMICQRNVEVPTFGTVVQVVPPLDRGIPLGVSSIPGKVYRVLTNDRYRIMYRNGRLSKAAIHVSSLSRGEDEEQCCSLLEAKASEQGIPLSTAARLYK